MVRLSGDAWCGCRVTRGAAVGWRVVRLSGDVLRVCQVARRLDRSVDAPELVIGADTVVTLDDVVYGKPTDKQDAFNMISKSVTGECVCLSQSRRPPGII